MKRLILILILASPAIAFSQSADEMYHTSAKLYVDEKTPEAKQMLNEGIIRYPDDEKMKKLRDLIKEEEKKKEDQKKEQQKKDQEQKDQDQKEQDQKDQEKKDQQQKDQKNQQDKEQQDKDQQQKEEEQKKSEDQKKNEKKDIPPSVSEKLKDMKMSEDKAKMVLEAMKNQEVQYLQQNKRKATKPKSKGKPDW